MFFNQSIDKFGTMVNNCATFKAQSEHLGEPYIFKPFKTPEYPHFRKSAYRPPINPTSNLCQKDSLSSIFKTFMSRDELELTSVYYNMSKFDIGRMSLKIFDEVPIISILHNSQDSNYRLDIKQEDLKTGRALQIDMGNLNIIFYCRKAILFKFIEESRIPSENHWKYEERFDRFKVAIVFKDKVDLLHFRDSLFCDKLEIVDVESSSLEEQHQEYLKKTKKEQAKELIKQEPVENMMEIQEPVIPTNEHDLKEDPDFPKFTYGPFDESFENKKLKNTIVNMKEKDKLAILNDIFKIKKESFTGTKTTKCPIWNCSQPFSTFHQLKQHVKKEHPQLQRNGIIHSDYDFSYEYTQKALNLAIYLGKTQPQEMKKLIKMMKLTMD